MYPRTTHSSGSISSRRHSVERPSSRRPSRWFGTIELVRANQRAESPVSTRPLSGISVGRTTSKVEMRSLATSSRRSSSSAYSSRTLPLPTWAVSGMACFLLPNEGAEPLEDGVDVTGVGGEIEDGVEIDASCELTIGSNELAEILFLVPGPKRVPLDEAVSLVPVEPRLYECDQEPLAEEESVARLEISAHPFGPHDQALDQRGKAVEHVVEREKSVGDDHPLRGRVRDVALVPERHVLEAHCRRGADDPREPADALRDDRVALVRHRGRPFLVASERLLNLAHLGSREMADLERELLQRCRGYGKSGQ